MCIMSQVAALWQFVTTKTLQIAADVCCCYVVHVSLGQLQSSEFELPVYSFVCWICPDASH